MWSNNTQTNYYQNQSQTQTQTNQTQNQKHDIFVGNLAFSTTEEQIHTAFSELGRIIKIRMVTDLETGKPRGFAFVEFENAQDALSAIRNMNEYELNGRKIRVNFSNSSHLETLAGQLGMDMTQKTKTVGSGGGEGSGVGGGATTSNIGSNVASGASHAQSSSDIGTQAVANALKNMSKGEMYDIIAKLKDIADNDPDEARKIISGHPQLPEALLFLMSQLNMMKTPLNTNVLGVGVGVGINTMVPPPVIPAIPPPGVLGMKMNVPPPPVDPRSAKPTMPPPPPIPIDPRALDPRNRTSDPRASDPRASDPRRQQQPPPSSNQPPPPRPLMPPQQPPPIPANAPPPPPMGVAGLDPSLVQQVMGLTQAQISQLPVDKQNSILALRQQIQNGMAGLGGGPPPP